MAKQWTDAQKEAIKDHKRGILVSAAAGSGKTTVLTERVAQKVLAGGDISRMLIVTFTNLAASEMRARIKERLSEELAKDSKNKHLRRQILLLPSAPISTMDAFCLELIRENHIITGVSASANIGDMTEIDSIKHIAAENVLKSSEIDEAAYEILNPERNDGNLIENIIKTYDYISSSPFLEESIDRLEEISCSDKPFIKTEYYKTLKKKAIFELKYIKELLNIKLKEARSFGIETELEVANTVNGDNAHIEKMIEELENDRYDEFYEALRKPFPTLKKVDSSPLMHENLKKFRDSEIKRKHIDVLKRVFSFKEVDYLADVKFTLPAIKLFFFLLRSFNDEYKRLKEEKEILDYSDVEHLTVKLLYQSSGVLSKFALEKAEDFDEIMVDEYQDTNETQNAIFTALSKSGQNLFTVGDVKQSIYRFRLADPTIFLKRKALCDENTANPYLITLNDNFRSSKGVCDFVNTVFSKIMSEAVGEMDYTDKEYLKNKQTADVETEIIIAEETSPEAEAVAVAEKIKELLSNGIEVSGEKKEIKPKDIAILMSARKKFPVFAKVFKDYLIPLSFDGAEGVLDTREGSSLFSLLNAIDNPGYDLHFAAAFLSPVFGFKTDDLVELKSKRKESLYKAALESENQRVLSFAALLKKYRAYSFTLSAYELIKKLFYETDFIEIFSSLEGGSTARKNLMSMLELSQSGRQLSLKGYIRKLEGYSEKGNEKANNFDADAVKIMTVHGSKGLEFPVCILSNSSRSLKAIPVNDSILIHKSLGVGIKIADKARHLKYTTAPYEAIKFTREFEELSEDMRLLYVALTRAKEKLIVSGSVKNRDSYLKGIAGLVSSPVTPEKAAFAKTMLDWVLLGSTIPSENGESSLKLRAGLMGKIVAFDFQEGEISNAEIKKEMPDKNILKTLKTSLEYIYPYSGIEKIPVRLSVSDISGGEKEPTFIKRPKFVSPEDSSAAEKGTILHKFMQYADFSLAAKDLNREIERLLEKAFLSEKEASLLNRKKIAAFFKSELYKRIEKADRVYREYSFIFSKNAGDILSDVDEKFKTESVLVQGIADCIIVENGIFTVIDYKTDNVKSEETLISCYKTQLQLYKEALTEKLGLVSGDTVIYSFALGKEIIF